MASAIHVLRLGRLQRQISPRLGPVFSDAGVSTGTGLAQASSCLQSLVPPCDLAVVLEELKGPPFEPPQGSDLKFVSLKMVHLLALASAKNVSDIHVLPVHPSSVQLFSSEVRIILKPN